LAEVGVCASRSFHQVRLAAAAGRMAKGTSWSGRSRPRGALAVEHPCSTPRGVDRSHVPALPPARPGRGAELAAGEVDDEAVQIVKRVEAAQQEGAAFEAALAPGEGAQGRCGRGGLDALKPARVEPRRGLTDSD